MLMVIFGAGASHGSARLLPGSNATERHRPPLTAQLFGLAYGDVADRYPASRPAIVRMRRALEEHPEALIETEIGRLGEAASRNPEQARHMMGLRFYLNDLIESRTIEWWKRLHGFTFYAQLLERLGRWRRDAEEEIALVTFNYDELLDFSLASQIGCSPFTTFDDYVARDEWRLYKLHGSTSWSRVLRAQVSGPLNIPSATDVIEQGHGLDFESGELRPRPWKDALGLADDPMTTISAPGIAVPTDQKHTFSCPANHVKGFAEDAEKTDRMLIIGWRGSEPHALEVLASRSPSVRQLAVADITEEKSADVLRNLVSGGIGTTFPAPLSGGFEGLLADDFLERWLTS
jgi:hypothetical protein